MNPTKPFRLTVKAVILDAPQRCLLLRRPTANRQFAGCWEWPGGKLDPGEDFAAGLRREGREEAGLEIELAPLAGATEYEMTGAHVILPSMEACPLTPAVRLSRGQDDFAWVPLMELSRCNILEPMRPGLNNLLERKEPHV